MRRPRRDAGCAGIGAGDRVEDRGNVAHAAGLDELDGQAAQWVGRHRPGGNAVAGGLEADETVARGRNADRAAAIAGVCDRHQPCRHRGARATAGAAGAAARVPRVAHGTKQLVLRRRRVAELGRLRGSRVDEAGAAEARHQLAVDRRDQTLGEPRTGVAAHACGMRDQFLGEEGNAGERSARQTGRHGFFRVARQRAADRVDLRIDPLDRGDRGLEQLTCRNLLCRDQLGKAEAVMVGVVVQADHVRLPVGGCPLGRRAFSSQRRIWRDRDRKGQSVRRATTPRTAAISAPCRARASPEIP